MTHPRMLALAAAAFAVLVASPAFAQVTIIGESLATECSQAARAGAHGIRAINVCSTALQNEPLGPRERAGTLVNRGVMFLRDRDWADAQRDFDTAVAMQPMMGEAWINRGAALVAQKRFAQGVADIDHGLALNPEEPEKAYYNRALALEQLDDMKGAYLAYMKASELAPAWQAPRTELQRFTVSRPN